MSGALKVGSLFDGIGCFSLAFVRAGFDLRWVVELDASCRRITAERFPGVAQYKDVTAVGGHNLEPADVVVGGSPCQDWSVAGKRAGLDGDRAPLFSHLPRVAVEVGARWFLWENVPGVLSQHGGRDFAAVLGAFTGCEPEVPPGGWRNSGWGWGRRGACCWRVLDARHFGVPQRRRRVFALVRLGDLGGLAGEESRPDLGRLLRLPAEVLLEPEGVFGHPEARGGAGAGVAGGAAGGAGEGGVGFDKYNQSVTGDVGSTLGAGSREHNNASVPHVFQLSNGGPGRRGLSGREATCSPTLDARAKGGAARNQGGLAVMAYAELGEGHQTYQEADAAPAVRANAGGSGKLSCIAASAMAVRRLTPTECLRLQGLPGGWMDVEPPLSDSKKYHMIGNGGAVPVVQWIAERLKAADGGEN